MNVMRKIITTICLFTSLSHAFALDAGDQVKMVLAKQKIYAGQWIGALNIYKEIFGVSEEEVEKNGHIPCPGISLCLLECLGKNYESLSYGFRRQDIAGNAA